MIVAAVAGSVGPGVARTEITGEHLIERFRLFFIVALGETVRSWATPSPKGRSSSSGTAPLTLIVGIAAASAVLVAVAVADTRSVRMPAP